MTIAAFVFDYNHLGLKVASIVNHGGRNEKVIDVAEKNNVHHESCRVLDTLVLRFCLPRGFGVRVSAVLQFCELIFKARVQRLKSLIGPVSGQITL